MASTMLGIMLAMNSASTDVHVATTYATITIDGGIKMPSVPEVVVSPALKRAGKPCFTIAGSGTGPIALSASQFIGKAPGRLATMMRQVGDYLGGEEPSLIDGWVAFRPLTPDGLPIVAPLSRHPRVVVASGHGMLGMMLAAATAQIVHAVLEGRREPELLSPKRYGG